MLFLAVIGFASYRTTSRLVATAGWVSHTHRVLENLEGALANMTVAESRVRSYIIAGAERYHEPFAADRKLATDSFRKARELTADNPAQQRRLDVLEPLVEERFTALQEVIDRHKDTPAQVERGTYLMDRIRQLVGVMSAEEYRLLGQRDQEAKASAQATTSVIVYGVPLAFVLVALIGLLIQRSIIGPLAQFKQFVGGIGEGDLTRHSTVRSGDELGDLAEGLNQMVTGLKHVAAQTRSASENLNSATVEILASAKQQSASTGEQAAAVRQTTITMEEISQSALQISERAKQVAAAAESTSLASRSGVEAVLDTNRTMEAIREQAEAVAENVVTLSERTQAVGEIVATVNDIAEQSHLLALNAAIQAAAAGEHGRSFSVVAGEIKNLADQSKAATVQVRSILGEIQKGIHNSVMLTEEAMKRVESGKRQADVAATAIGEMGDSIQQSVQAFQQIVAGTNQQQIGLQQVMQAVKDIGNASQQTASSTRQLEQAAANLAALGGQLRNSVERYRT